MTIQEEMNINRRTISEITKIMWDSDNEVRRKKTLNNNIVSLTLLYVLGAFTKFNYKIVN